MGDWNPDPLSATGACLKAGLGGKHNPRESHGSWYCRNCGALLSAPEHGEAKDHRKVERDPNSDTAWNQLEHSETTKREQLILELLFTRSMTTYELEGEIGLSHQTVSSRVSEMWHRKRVIRPSGERRRTNTLRPAHVMEPGDPMAKSSKIPHYLDADGRARMVPSNKRVNKAK